MGRAELARPWNTQDYGYTVLALMKYEAEVGKLPERWSDMVPRYLPETPEDPFDQQPLRFVAGQEHVLIYSVGADQEDDGGSASGGGYVPDDDISLTWPPTEPPQVPEREGRLWRR